MFLISETNYGSSTQNYPSIFLVHLYTIKQVKFFCSFFRGDIPLIIFSIFDAFSRVLPSKHLFLRLDHFTAMFNHVYDNSI